MVVLDGTRDRTTRSNRPERRPEGRRSRDPWRCVCDGPHPVRWTRGSRWPGRGVDGACRHSDLVARSVGRGARGSFRRALPRPSLAAPRAPGAGDQVPTVAQSGEDRALVLRVVGGCQGADRAWCSGVHGWVRSHHGWVLLLRPRWRKGPREFARGPVPGHRPVARGGGLAWGDRCLSGWARGPVAGGEVRRDFDRAGGGVGRAVAPAGGGGRGEARSRCVRAAARGD